MSSPGNEKQPYRSKGFWRKPKNQFWIGNDSYRDNQGYFKNEFLPQTSVKEDLRNGGGTGGG